MEIMQLTTEKIRNRSRKQKKIFNKAKTLLDIEPKLLFTAKSFDYESNSDFLQTNKSACNRDKIKIIPYKENKRIKILPSQRNERIGVSTQNQNHTPMNMRTNKCNMCRSFSSVVPNNSNPCSITKKITLDLPSNGSQNNCDFLVHADRRGHISCSDTNIDKLRTFTNAIFDVAQELCSVISNDTLNEKEITFTVSFDVKNVRKQHKAQQITNSELPTLIRNNVAILPRDRKLLANKSDVKLDNSLKNEMQCKNDLDKSYLTCDDFLRTAAIFSVTNYIYSCSTAKVPSLRHRQWHFQNIAQGYLLRTLLKSTNVNTLNVMRNIYFVLITTDSPNLILKAYFRVRNDVFMLQGINPVNDFCHSRPEWNNEDENYIDRRILRRTLSDLPPPTKPKITDAVKFDSSDSTLTENNASRQTLSESASFPSSQPSRCTLVVGKRNATTSNIYSLRDNVAQRSNPTTNIAVDCDSLVNIQNYSDQKWRGLYIKPLFANVFRVPNTSLRKGLNFEYFDETIFEQVSIKKYVQSVTDKCTAPEFYTVFLKCLGHTLGCTLVSFFISIL